MEKRNLVLSVIVILLVCFTTEFYAQGFLHRVDKKIYNGAGQEVLLKGIGLGGWLVQEGYMLQTSAFANAQWQIKAKILDLIGEANTETFYQTYRNNYVRKPDIDSLKKWGFNSIRLPMHYNLFANNTNPPVFLSLGFEIIDSLLSWCETNQIYLILDLHAAPGGQSDEPISDYNPANPSLWESEQNKNLTVQIWRKIAERYKDKEWIGGYDLINEPKWNLPPNNQPLRDLYIRLTDTIRAVDNNHLIFIEGNWFATDFNGLTPAWDDNMAYSFHKYWNGNTQSSIQYLVDLRNNTNRPLWLGETGENSNKWFVDCVELMKTNNIGWAWWPHKKIESIAGPLSAYKLPGYQSLLNYWSGTAPRPTATVAFNALMAQANQLLIENCKFQKDVIDALIRQPNNNNTVPFSANTVPGIINATEYDMGQITFAYNDNDFENVGSNGTWNTGWSFRNDGVDIEACTDFNSNGYNVGWIETGEWLQYTLNVEESGIYKINLNLSAPATGGKILLALNGQYITSVMDVPATGGWQNWQFLSVDSLYIPAGNHILQTRFFFGDYNFSYMDFILVATDVEVMNNNPINYQLEQNYPNPFNPITSINYSIAKASNVELKIFDALGNEIKTLVSEYKNPGKYSYEFDAKNLASGVYFYQIKAADFISIKKLVLIK